MYFRKKKKTKQNKGKVELVLGIITKMKLYKCQNQLILSPVHGSDTHAFLKSFKFKCLRLHFKIQAHYVFEEEEGSLFTGYILHRCVRVFFDRDKNRCTLMRLQPLGTVVSRVVNLFETAPFLCIFSICYFTIYHQSIFTIY